MSTTTGPVVVAEHLSKRYRIGALQHETMLRERLARMLRRPQADTSDEQHIWALNDVSFNVEEGEVLGIVGRNGAGKSTLLKVLSRITHPTSGRMSVQGRVASLLEVGTGFHEELTGRENIFLNGSILGMTKKEVAQRLDAIIEFSGVETFVDTPIKRYSSGMRLRLGFAVAAHLEPEVLIVDEVLAVGDAGFQKKCLTTMNDMRGQGRTVLFVSHNLAAVENLCSRAIWIENGSIRMDGDVRPVLENYMRLFSDIQATGTDLSNITQRQGSGETIYTGVEFLDEHGYPQGLIRSGMPLTIRFRICSHVIARNISIGFRLYTDLGTLVTETSTWHHSKEIVSLAAGDHCVDLRIANLNLTAGNYVLSLWITGADHEVLDGIENCISLEVAETDVYGSGKNLDGQSGITFFPQAWNMSGLTAEE